ncbi:hypothetical protein GF406_00830 [candidate division KSB1 bacterium]|nr:hypothetical protein [candidate division KSB1 bacterium]
MERCAFTRGNRSKPQRGGVFQPRAIAIALGKTVNIQSRALKGRSTSISSKKLQCKTGASNIYTLLHHWARGERLRFGSQSSLRGDKPRGGESCRKSATPDSQGKKSSATAWKAVIQGWGKPH